jgi:hypothetical protein
MSPTIAGFRKRSVRSLLSLLTVIGSGLDHEDYVRSPCTLHFVRYILSLNIFYMQFCWNIQGIPPYSWCIYQLIWISQDCIWCKAQPCTICRNNLREGLLWWWSKIVWEWVIASAYSIYWAVEYSISKDWWVTFFK